MSLKTSGSSNPITMSKTRDEAIAAGAPADEVRHSMKRRLTSHDYHAVGTYMLTLVVEGRVPLFGRLCGSIEHPQVELSPLGEDVRDVQLKKISEYYPMVEVWKLCVMPDHLHLIIRIREPLPEGRHLGHVVSGFKSGCTRAWWFLQDAKQGAPSPCGEPQGTVAPPAAPAPAAPVPGGSPPGAAALSAAPAAPVPGGSPSGAAALSAAPAAPVPGGSPPGSVPPAASRRPVLFEKGYCDKILLRDGQLDNWKHYLDDNPRRLAIKRQFPQYFTVLHQIQLMGIGCQMVGNRFLLDIPDRAAVIVHNAYSDAEFENYRQQWLAVGEAGGVLISAAVASREKAVMREAMNRGYNLILLRENGFPPLYKPSGEAFDACSDGRLLQISPWPHHTDRRIISREQCLFLNRLAEYLAITPLASLLSDPVSGDPSSDDLSTEKTNNY